MEMTKITKTINQPTERVEWFADQLGYQTVVTNLDYKEAVGSEIINDPSGATETVEGLGEVPKQVPNPDYVAAVGERTIENPQSRTDFVSEKFDDMTAVWFSQFAHRDATRAALAGVEVTVAATKAAIRNTIMTVK